MATLSTFPLRPGLLLVALTASVAVAQPAKPPLPRPLTLQGALAYAVDHNPGLLRVREQIREQQGVLVETRAGQLPSVSASGQYSRTDDSLLTTPQYRDENWSVSVTARQTIYAGGGVQARVKAQREQLEAAKLAFAASCNDTLLSVRTEFYGVLLAREMIRVQEEELAVLENELTNARHRRDAGTGSDFDVLRAEVSVANARPTLIRARNTYRTSQDQLRATLGGPDGDTSRATDLEVQGSLEVPRADVQLADALFAAAANRPELQQLDRQARAAEQGVTSAKSGYLPTVSAYAGYQWQNAPILGTSDTRLKGWSAGLQSSWSIFDGRATAGRVSQARSKVNQLKYSIEERQLAVSVEVRQAHSSFVEATELLASSAKVVEQAVESLRLAQARFQAGTATQLDVLTAQSQLTLARSNLAQSRHDYAVALANLSRAVGNGTKLASSS